MNISLQWTWKLDCWQQHVPWSKRTMYTFNNKQTIKKNAQMKWTRALKDRFWLSRHGFGKAYYKEFSTGYVHFLYAQWMSKMCTVENVQYTVQPEHTAWNTAFHNTMCLTRRDECLPKCEDIWKSKKIQTTVSTVFFPNDDYTPLADINIQWMCQVTNVAHDTFSQMFVAYYITFNTM